MTPVEFKAWFEGYVAALGSNSITEEQFKEIKEKILTMDVSMPYLGKLYRDYVVEPINVFPPFTTC